MVTLLENVEQYRSFLNDNDFTCIFFAKDESENITKCTNKCKNFTKEYPELQTAVAYIGNLVNETIDNNLYCVYRKGEKQYECETSKELVTFIDPVYSVSPNDDLDVLFSQKSIVFLDFTAKWCRPCKHIAPTYRGLARIYKNALFLKIDVDKNPSIVEKYRIRSMPTFYCIVDGKEKTHFTGSSEKDLCQMISDNA